MNCSKILIAAVNGDGAVGFMFTTLPLFDLGKLKLFTNTFSNWTI